MPSTTTAFPAPSLALLAAEPIRALFDYCSARMGHPAPVTGDGHPVIVYPGLGASAFTTAQLRSHLVECKLSALDWELGVNTGPEGDFDAWLDPLAARVETLHKQHGRRVSLVGWSLGGIYAREIAKRAPRAVRQVVTLATPFAAMAGGNHAGAIFKMLGGDTSGLTPKLLDRLRQRPPVPTTSIYSESDGLVSWRGCLETPAADVENIAVGASHLGMTSHPEVLRLVADRLAQREGRWRPYAARRIKPATAPSR
ncbi:alpha/beta hydrolase [Ramlibacter sp. XY19]|uniref:esterase/lipase family protein n=1 Tax=Ramlibacter paludis TaxID=2908000 RepID=UPI0023DA7B1E|nr:alpha/beta hydrolase [Ramlibacter paludis]MCG2594044.1 alpha/beta hydrolase [Ramlibacter paludis]